MYKEFYGLRERPFNKTPDPRFLYHSPKHAEALARLLHAVEEQDIVLLTGEIGSGKTTLSRAFIDSLDESYHPLLIINPRLSPSQLLRTVALRLGMDDASRYRHGILEGINAKLYELYEAGRRPVIIIDEAQLIPGKATFEELRLLTNFQLDDRNLLAARADRPDRAPGAAQEKAVPGAPSAYRNAVSSGSAQCGRGRGLRSAPARDRRQGRSRCLMIRRSRSCSSTQRAFPAASIPSRGTRWLKDSGGRPRSSGRRSSRAWLTMGRKARYDRRGTTDEKAPLVSASEANGRPSSVVDTE